MSTTTSTTTTPRPQQTVRPQSRPAVKGPSEPRGNQTFLFDRTNYTWMIGGVVLIILGLVLMAGGKSPDPHQFNYDEIYSFRRITLAPIIMLLGFAVEVFAIMKKPAVQA